MSIGITVDILMGSFIKKAAKGTKASYIAVK